MAYALSREERETLIRWNMAEKSVVIDTADPAVIRRLDKLAVDHPQVYACTRSDETYGAKRYTLCDKRYVRFGKPASEALKESMANARAARSVVDFGRIRPL